MAGRGRALLERDLASSAGCALVFSLALGIATVALPLYALATGYSKTAVGVFAALSAATQMTTRLTAPRFMRHFSESVLVLLAGGVLALSCLAVALSHALAPFVAGQLLQGVARGWFWTGTQTHVVRRPGPAVGRLAAINFFSSIGLLTGPVLAGIIGARSMRPAIALAAGVAVLAVLPALGLDRLAPFVREPAAAAGAQAWWRQPGVRSGCLAGVTAGGWRALLNSYVPVALRRAGQSAPVIGLLVSVASGASLVGSVLVSRARERGMTPVLLAGTVVTGLGMAITALVAGAAPAAAGALALSGLGAGALQTLGPASAAAAVSPQLRGAAISVSGAFRAGSLFTVPLTVGLLLAAVSLTPAMTLAGAVLALPALALRAGRTTPDVPPAAPALPASTGERAGG